MVTRMCKHCRYCKKTQKIDRYEDNSYFKWGINRYCTNKNSNFYKKNVYSNNICEHYVTNSFLYRLHNRFCYFLYKIDAKIKGIEIKEAKK